MEIAKLKALHSQIIRKLAWLGLTGAGLLISMCLGSGSVQAAACTVPSPDLGIATSSINVPSVGSYRVWSRMMAPDNAAKRYLLEIDGTTCISVGGSASISATAWTWVDYQDGNPATTSSLSLTAGSHVIRMIGNAVNVELDRIIFTTDVSCSPTGTGDNCATAPDTISPTVSLTAPVGGATVSGTTTLTATASDNIGVTQVEFYIDGVLKSPTDTTSPYNYSWDTTTATNGIHSLTAKAYDAAGNSTLSTAVSVTVNNTVSDTQAPTASLTPPPANGATVTGTVNLTAMASDNVGVTKVDFYSDTNLVGSATTLSSGTAQNGTWQIAWNTTTVANGIHSLTAKAYDAAGNSTVSAAVTVTSSNTATVVPGDVSGDGHVNALDLSVLLGHWAATGASRAMGDLSGDGVVNALDLSILLSNWGR